MTAALLAATLAAASLQAAADEGGLRVKGPLFELHLAPAAGWTTLEKQPTAGTELGTLAVSGRFTDYRGQPVPAGTYVLILALQPPLKDHFGTAPAPEFALLAGAGVPLDRVPRSAGGAHPLVLRVAIGDSPGPPGLAEAHGEVLARPRPGRAALVVVGRAKDPEF